MTEGGQGRREELVTLSALMCLCVVFIHSASEAVSALRTPSLAGFAVYVPWKLASFAVPGFFFAGGMKQMLSRDRQRYPAYLLGRLKRVVLPYLLWCVLYFVSYRLTGDGAWTVRQFLRAVFTGELAAPFYFVTAVVQFYVLRPLLLAAADRFDALPALGVALMVTVIGGSYLPFWFADRLFTAYLVYWMAGLYAGKHCGAFVGTLREKKPAVTVLFAVIAACELALTYLTYTGTVYFGFFAVLHTGYCLAATAAAYLLCLYLPLWGWVRRLGEASYGIYLSHCLVLYWLVWGMSRTQLSLKAAFAVRTAVLFAYALLYSIISSSVKNKFIKNRLQ